MSIGSAVKLVLQSVGCNNDEITCCLLLCSLLICFVFRMKVANLRQRFFHSITPGGLAGDRRAVVPASGFSFSAQQIWKIIKENKDLDLPAHKVMKE